VLDDVQIRTPTYRVVRQRGMDPTTRRLTLIAAGFGSALMAIMGAWSLGGGGHHLVRTLATEGEVPVIEPPPGPMKVKPANPGGMQISANQNLFGSPSDDKEKLAPPPQVPDPAALQPPPPPPALPKPAAGAPVAPVSTAPIAAIPVAPPPLRAAALASAPVAPAGDVLVQLAALPTEQAAKDEWALLQKKLSELLKSRQPTITSADVSGRTWWRVRTGVFPDPAAAKQFCDGVRAKGGSCDVVHS
jgi:SPOR domain